MLSALHVTILTYPLSPLDDICPMLIHAHSNQTDTDTSLTLLPVLPILRKARSITKAQTLPTSHKALQMLETIFLEGIHIEILCKILAMPTTPDKASQYPNGSLNGKTNGTVSATTRSLPVSCCREHAAALSLAFADVL